MIFILFLLSLFDLVNCNIFNIENSCNYNSLDSCLDNFFCSWCNVSKLVNNTVYYVEQCNYNNYICSNNFTESSMCVYQKNYNYSCNFYETLVFFLIAFVLVTSTYSISYSLTRSFSKENHNRSCGVVIIILLLINIPAFILWTTYSNYFGFYMLCLIFISFIACCTNSTKRYIHYKKTKRVGYELINE
jgi:hypothetical protein